MKINTKKIIFACALLLYLSPVLFISSCYSGSVMDDPEICKEEVDGWLTRVKQNPDDFDALKNLSVYYVQTNKNAEGDKYIAEALKIKPDDPELLFYKGVNLEFFNKKKEALDYYKKYTGILNDSQYKDMMEGRYLWLKRQQAYSDVDSLIKREKEQSAGISSDSTIAVFPLIYRGINKDYFPLSRGFSEMISIDLAKVKELTILERIRIQAVLDELKFGQSAAVDKSTAPRVGKLLGAGTIVSGNYDVTNSKEFKIDLGSWEVRTSKVKSWVNISGNLDDFFTLQKEVVFDFLKKNNIELTHEEQEAIAYIPTQNLQAFLAFSKGLMLEDSGDFEGAALLFKKAVDIDPNFKAAKEKMKSSESISRVGGAKEQLITGLTNTLPAIRIPEIDIFHDRRVIIDNNVFFNFNRNEIDRSPAKDIKEIRSILPDPPPPPARK